MLKGALALDFRFHATARATRDMDLGRADDEDAVVEDFGAAQELVLDGSSRSPYGEQARSSTNVLESLGRC